MRPLVLSLLLTYAMLGAPSVASARTESALRPEESARLTRGETVTRQQTFERGDHRYVGGLTYTLLDASPTEVAAVFDDVESIRRILPRTKRAHVVASSGPDQLIEIATGNALMEAEYTLRVRHSATEARFWLDPSRPHGIDDAWGFFRYQPFVTSAGETHVLLTYAVLVDVGPGIVRDLFEERVRAALLGVPQLVRRTVAERRFAIAR